MSAPKRNLVVVRAGDSSLHPSWLLPEAERNWDLVVSYYGDQTALYRAPGVLRIDQKGPKWRGLAALFDSDTLKLDQYRNIWLPDDDLAISGSAINAFFQIFEQLQLEIAQPALHWESYFSHPITLKHPGFKYRLVNFVEGMAPCFRRDFFDRVRPTFSENISGWGIDIAWQRFLSRPIGGSAIIDLIELRHTRPVGGPNYGHLADAGKSAIEEMKQVQHKYGMERHVPAVFAGQTVNDQWRSLTGQRSQLVFDCAAALAPRLSNEPAQLGTYLLQLLAAAAPAPEEQAPGASPTGAAARETAKLISAQVFGLGQHGFNTEHFSHIAAALDSARYRNQRLRQAPCFASGRELLQFALTQTTTPGLRLEFGVGDGGSVRQIGAQTSGPVFGFDSFAGLPETWRPGYAAGTFRQAALPEVPPNVHLVQGLFAESLPGFLAENPQAVAFLHIDCDLYSSTATIFAALAPRIVPGTVIVFDEYLNFPGWQHDEFRAFQEYIAQSKRGYRYIGQVPSHQQVAVIIE